MLKGLVLLFLILACLLLISCTVLAQPVSPILVTSEPVSIRSETSREGVVTLNVGVWQRDYEVPGLSADEIAVNLDALRLHGGGHDAYSAQTKWDIRWSVRYDRSGGACSLQAVTIDVYAVITMPSLLSSNGLSSAELERWGVFLDALLAHELQHVENEAAGAESFRRALLALGSYSDCAELGGTVQALGEQAKQWVREADIALDAETEHGASDGATFP